MPKGIYQDQPDEVFPGGETIKKARAAAAAVLTDYVRSIAKSGGGTQLMGDVLLAEGANITITVLGQTITIAAASGSAAVQQQFDLWYKNDIDGGAFTVNMPKIGNAEHDAFDNDLVMGKAGSLILVYVLSNAARTDGDITVSAWKNGASWSSIQANLDAVNTTFDTGGPQAAGIDTFVAGDRLSMRVAGPGGWLPTTADLRAGVVVQWS